jgi:hypothetical protein
MSLAHLDTRPTGTVSPIARPVASAAQAAEAPTAHLRAVPSGTEARGFVLYVGIDEDKAAADGTDLSSIVAQLRALAAQLSPSSETYAAVALAPRGAGGRPSSLKLEGTAPERGLPTPRGMVPAGHKPAGIFCEPRALLPFHWRSQS